MINPFAARPPAASAIEVIKFILADSLTEAPKRRRYPNVIIKTYGSNEKNRSNREKEVHQAIALS